ARRGQVRGDARGHAADGRDPAPERSVRTACPRPRRRRCADQVACLHRPDPLTSVPTVTKVLTHMCMSLDGFVAQPDDNPGELFDWYWGGDVVVPSAQESMSFSTDAASAGMLRELTS